jgi:exodeoxyribonuclease VII large subunit
MLDDLLKPAPEHILKVTELTRQIKAQLEGRFNQLWVQGEVSNLRRQSSGHVYFSLKDAGSQLPCVIFARDAARQSFELSDGMEVLLFGDLSVYEPHGRYQLIAKIAIQSGEGRLQIEFERLKRKLAAEGLFEKERKQPLPSLPRRIAVVTSPTGAALQDFLRILRRRNYRGEVVIFPARVQGRGAAEEIAAMLEHAGASAGFDLVVITRGGGSIEDLWAFNEELLARAVAACPLPIISAVGHEIDTVLTDYAADQRAETPSAAAELLSSLYLESIQRIETTRQNIASLADTEVVDRQRTLREFQSRMQIIAPDRQIEHLSMKLDDLENQLGHSLRDRLRGEQDNLSQLAQRMTEHHPRIKIGLAEQSLRDFSRRLERSVRLETQNRATHLLQMKTRLENTSPTATLKRGYSIIQKTDGSIVSDAKTARQEDALRAQFNDGTVDVKVNK